MIATTNTGTKGQRLSARGRRTVQKRHETLHGGAA
jgi:hypothetical protein